MARPMRLQRWCPCAPAQAKGSSSWWTNSKALCIPSPQLFPDGMVSDQPERQLVAEIIREKMLQKLDKEVPHGVAVEIERWEERDDGLIAINAAIYCERKTHKGIIIGKNGAMLKQIGAVSRYEIERMLDAKVYLELWVKVKEDLAE